MVRTRKSNHKGRGYRRRAGKLSIGAAFFWLVLFVCAGIGGAAYFVYITINKDKADSISPHAQSIARAYAHTIGNLIKYHIESLSAVVRDESVVAAFTQGDIDARRKQEKRIRLIYPSASRVKLLTKGVGEPDMSLKPPLTEACLYLQQQAETNKQPYAEIHGNPVLHMDMLRSVKDPSTGKQVGHVLITFNINTLQESIKRLVSSGYVELQQVALGKTYVLMNVGKKDFKKNMPTKSERVPGTKWMVQYWSNPKAAPINPDNELLFWGSFGAVATLLLFLALIFYKVLAGRIKKDGVTLVYMFKDINDRDLAENYVANLKNLKQTFEELSLMAYDMVKDGKRFDELESPSPQPARLDASRKPKAAPPPQPPAKAASAATQPAEPPQPPAANEQDPVGKDISDELDDVLNFNMDSVQIDDDKPDK